MLWDKEQDASNLAELFEDRPERSDGLGNGEGGEDPSGLNSLPGLAYLKITRSGSTFTAYTPTDGVTWTLIPGSTITLNLGTSLLAGLAAASPNSGALGTVVMDSVDVG